MLRFGGESHRGRSSGYDTPDVGRCFNDGQETREAPPLSRRRLSPPGDLALHHGRIRAALPTFFSEPRGPCASEKGSGSITGTIRAVWSALPISCETCLP
jgi:hypothetical protein